MPKRPLKLKVRLPIYTTPRNQWRREISAKVWEVQQHTDVHYAPTDRLQIQIRLYLTGNALTIHDLDNTRLTTGCSCRTQASGSNKRWPATRGLRHPSIRNELHEDGSFRV